MVNVVAIDEGLAANLPLPLARLYRDAHNARHALERHQNAFYLWEAAIKLIGSVAAVTYAEKANHDDGIGKTLQKLARPSLGDWREIIRKLVPILKSSDSQFASADALLSDANRDDLPLCAGLDAALRRVLEGKGHQQSKISPAQLLNRVVTYRNRHMGHGALGRHGNQHYALLGEAFLAAGAEWLSRLELLVVRNIVYLVAVEATPAGDWTIEWQALHGHAPSRLNPWTVPGVSQRPPRPGRVYLAKHPTDRPTSLLDLTPLVVYDADTTEVLILNSRRDENRADYLDYTSGRTDTREDLALERRELLARALSQRVSQQQFAAWADEERVDEAAGEKEIPDEPSRQQIGEFEIISKLGQGGMGIVYRALQPSLDRQVALKHMYRTGDSRAERRFAREIQALGRVAHPHLVKIHTAASDGAQWFYAMELLEGASLANVFEQLASRTQAAAGIDVETWRESLTSACAEARNAEVPIGLAPLENLQAKEPPASIESPAGGYVAWAVELIRQIAEAAHALHEAKPHCIIHRDIKPGNVMVSLDGARAVLVDLGIAHFVDGANGKLTRTREFVGTDRYASPEQLGGATLDRRGDVYSLGATLWELLTLRPLFDVKDTEMTPDVILRLQRAEPERPNLYNRSVPMDVEAIVLKCLEKEPADRYESARALAQDIERWQRGEPVIANTLTTVFRIRKAIRKRRMWITWIAGLAALQAIVIAGVVYFRPGRNVPDLPTTVVVTPASSSHRTDDPPKPAPAPGPLAPDEPEPAEGLKVASVRTGSPAERAGLKKGDVIVRVDETLVTSLGGWRRALVLGRVQRIRFWDSRTRRFTESELSVPSQPDDNAPGNALGLSFY